MTAYTLAVVNKHVTGGHIAHKPRACGTNGVTTNCGLLLARPWNTTRVDFDNKGAMNTAQNDTPCKLCFGDGK